MKHHHHLLLYYRRKTSLFGLAETTLLYGKILVESNISSCGSNGAAAIAAENISRRAMFVSHTHLHPKTTYLFKTNTLIETSGYNTLNPPPFDFEILKLSFCYKK